MAAIEEVSLLSDFTVDRDSLLSRRILSYVKRVETRNDEWVLIAHGAIAHEPFTRLDNGQTLGSGSCDWLVCYRPVCYRYPPEMMTQWWFYFYFDKMVKQEYCPTVSAFRTHKVAKQKSLLYIRLLQLVRARALYKPRKTTLCDLYEDEDICVSQSNKRKDNVRTVSAASHYACVYLQFMFFSFHYLLHKYL